MVEVRVCVLAALVGAAVGQFGIYDLDVNEQTKLVGTTSQLFGESCFSAPSGICGDGGRTIFTPDSVHENLAAWFTFDDAHGLDSSGKANHALSPPPAVGPGHNSRGQSAHFDGTTSFSIPHSEVFDGQRQMTVSFWIYLLTDSTDSWRVLFRKGDGVTDLTPTLLLFPDSRKLHVRMSTSDPTKNGLDSIGAIPLKRWTHVAVAINFNVLTIFINGIQDNQGMISGEVNLNTGSWYVGKDKHLPGTGMYLDNFKVYTHALDEQSLQVEASTALPGLGPNFLRLGCKSCSLEQAIQKCSATNGYHLCRSLELQGGGLMVARSMGYLDFATQEWTAEDSAGDVEQLKLGLCCLD